MLGQKGYMHFFDEDMSVVRFPKRGEHYEVHDGKLMIVDPLTSSMSAHVKYESLLEKPVVVHVNDQGPDVYTAIVP